MRSQSPQAANETKLLVLATDQKVHAYDLAGFSRVGIGRHESNDIQLPSRAVSNFHAEILKEDGTLVIRDLGSTNGTRVNGERVDRSPVSPGDSIRIGNHVLSLQVRAPAATPAFASGIGPDGFGHGLPAGASSPRKRARSIPTGRPIFLSPIFSAGSPRGPSLIGRFSTRDGAMARLLFDRERLFHVEYGDVVGEKALYRLFSWHDGSYEIETLADPGFTAGDALPSSRSAGGRGHGPRAGARKARRRASAARDSAPARKRIARCR